jgi:hypothetical protein
VLPLCHAALVTWQRAEGRDAPSPLAVKSVRALISPIIVVMEAGAGSRRWCETAISAPPGADTFGRIFPDTTFLCLHRSFPGVLASGLAAHPWGLGTSPFWPYSGPHAGNSAATIAAYWAARTEALLDFEARHAASSCRVRYEDLRTDPAWQAERIYTRLCLDRADLASLPLTDDLQAPESRTGEPTAAAPDGYSMPRALRTTVNRLSERLGYQALPEPTGN